MSSHPGHSHLAVCLFFALWLRAQKSESGALSPPLNDPAPSPKSTDWRPRQRQANERAGHSGARLEATFCGRGADRICTMAPIASAFAYSSIVLRLFWEGVFTAGRSSSKRRSQRGFRGWQFLCSAHSLTLIAQIGSAKQHPSLPAHSNEVPVPRHEPVCPESTLPDPASRA
jgi:hypothetical protein